MATVPVSRRSWAALIHEGGRAATDLIRAGQIGSPILDARLQHCLREVREVRQPVADLVRQFYASVADGDEPADDRSESLRIRLSAAEKAELQRQAGEAGETVSAYIRSALKL